MKRDEIIESNKTYWNDHADLWFGTTALPVYGVRFPTEDDLHLFSDVAGKKMLEICCGSGHSLKYNAEKGAGELWGVDLSQKQLDNAAKLLSTVDIRQGYCVQRWRMNLKCLKGILIMYIPFTALVGQPIYREHLIRLLLT